MNLMVKLDLEENEPKIIEYLEIKYKIKLKNLLKPSKYDRVRESIESINLYDFVLKKYEFVEPIQIKDIERFNNLLIENNYLRLKK